MPSKKSPTNFSDTGDPLRAIRYSGTPSPLRSKPPEAHRFHQCRRCSDYACVIDQYCRNGLLSLRNTDPYTSIGSHEYDFNATSLVERLFDVPRIKRIRRLIVSMFARSA